MGKTRWRQISMRQTSSAHLRWCSNPVRLSWCLVRRARRTAVDQLIPSAKVAWRTASWPHDVVGLVVVTACFAFAAVDFITTMRRYRRTQSGSHEKPTWKRSAYCDECERPRARRGHGGKGTAFARLYSAVQLVGALSGRQHRRRVFQRYRERCRHNLGSRRQRIHRRFRSRLQLAVRSLSGWR
jgi:hypothetical protein